MSDLYTVTIELDVYADSDKRALDLLNKAVGEMMKVAVGRVSMAAERKDTDA